MGLFGRKNKYDEIEKWRKKIDKIDIRIVRLLNRRARYADEIGKLKQELNLPIYSPEREKQVIENVTKHNFGPLSDMAIKRLYERIIDESRRLERESAEQREKLQQIYNFKNGNVKLLDNLRHLILLLSLLLLFYLNKNLFIINIPPTKLEIVDIPKNSSFKFVLETLSDRGLIRDKFLALTVSKVFGYDKKIKSGRYILSDNLPIAVVLNEIVNPKLVFAVTVTIPEGLTAKRIAGILKSKVGVDSAKFMSLVNSPEFARKLGIESNTLEGYLMPDTYHFIWGDEEENIISRLVEEFKKFYNDTFKIRAKELGLTTHQVITLASIVEGEAMYEDEKPRIAGVYLNRLKRNMPLEADPTIQYIIPDGPRRLYYKDLTIQSPYNTYLNKGLPPGPVNNPGKSSILAVLYPEKHKFLYFVSDGRGRHVFSKTYEEHLTAVRRYRKLLVSKKSEKN
jgi:UPF0755 protein